LNWTFGLSQSEIEMNVLGFGVQNNLFRLIYDNDGSQIDFMTDLAIAFSLIGFSIILLTLGRLSFAQVFGWFILFLITLVRPVGDTAFFTKLSEQNSPEIYQSACRGLSLTQRECVEAAGAQTPNRTTFVQQAESRGYRDIYAYTPQLVSINALNRINQGLADQFLLPGQRLLDGVQPAMEALRRGRTSSEGTNFHLSQFLAVCANSDSGAALRLASAYVPYTQLERQGSNDILNALRERRIRASDAIQLFLQYDNYAQRHHGSELASLLLPPLVCPPRGCSGQGSWNVRDANLPVHEQIPAILRPITVNSAEDFVRVRDNRRTVHADTLALLNRLQRSETNTINRMLNEQHLSLAVPLSSNAIAATMRFESAQSGADPGINIGPTVNAVGTALGAVGGCAAGGLAGGQAAGVVGAGLAATGVGAIPGAILTGAGAVLGCIGGAIGAGAIAHAALPKVWDVNIPIIGGSGSARTPNPEPVYIVQNCADFHRLTDARLFVDTALANRLSETYGQVVQSGRLPEDFQNMSPQQRAMVALHEQLEAQRQRCNERWFASRRASCVAEAERNIGELIAYTHTMAVNNTLPSILASEQIRAGSSPQMIGNLRNFMIGAGDVFAPIGVELRAMWGGFEAGTYAKIMPFIVSFGTALVIMITPFLYVIGLLVPMWSISILLIPIVGVLYFQLVKTVFMLINVIANTMIGAHSQGMITSQNAAFSDIILGTGYTMAFILSAGLLFALKNPAAIIQNVAGKADGLSQISWQQAVATAYIGQKAVSMAGNALSPKKWGELAGEAKNMAAGRGGWLDQFQASEADTRRRGDDVSLAASQSRITPRESEDSLQMRAGARAIEDINRRADEADKGSKMEGSLRKGRRFAYVDPRGNQKFVDLDAANVALGELLDKSAPELANGRDMARKLLNQKIVVAVEHDDGSRYLQLDTNRLAQTADQSIHKYIDRLKSQGHFGEIDKNGQKHSDILIKAKI
jgi:hypothetical protein